jgi:hyaluronoglucosaminidase
MTERYRIPVGVIEGFFGKPWSWDDRASYAEFLRELGFDFYIYAPKDDRYLRQRWREPWPEAMIERAAALAETYREAGVGFGIGLSPFELHLEDAAGQAAALRNKVRQLNDVGSDILCILLDDMRGRAPDLAARQVRLVEAICSAGTAKRFVVCPTYYSFDPVLERVFGARPDRYLSDLGGLLDPRIDVFWTGPRICSRRYPEDHLAEVAALLRRRPFLWDNYPVNDSAAMAPFLHLGPFRDRPAALQGLIAGHAVNPMNQARLSRIPLRTLADSYAEGAAYDPEASFAAACRSVGDGALGQLLIEDLVPFQKTGLAAMTAEQRRALTRRYDAFAGNPYADEVRRWLAGGYPFDPACLL